MLDCLVNDFSQWDNVRMLLKTLQSGYFSQSCWGYTLILIFEFYVFDGHEGVCFLFTGFVYFTESTLTDDR